MTAVFWPKQQKFDRKYVFFKKLKTKETREEATVLV